MIRLIIIRICEALVRNLILIISPAILVTLAVVALQITQSPSYLSGATVQIRYNREISRVIGYEKYEGSYWDPSELFVLESYELLRTDEFVDGIIERVGFEELNGAPLSRSDVLAIRELLRDNFQIDPAGMTQVGVLAYMPTPELAQDVILAFFDEYMAHQIETIGGSGEDLVEYMSIYKDAKETQKVLVEAELQEYLRTHPENPFFDRREIEQAQIFLLVSTIEDLDEDIQFTKDWLDFGYLVENTADRYFEETFTLLDAPFPAISMTSTTKKISNIIQGAAAGVVLSVITAGVLVLFDRRVILPLDLHNVTELPLLTMVATEKAHQKQRYAFVGKRLRQPLRQWIAEKIRERMVSDGYTNNSRNTSRSGKQNRRLNTIR
ncbi:MAG: hypothetical protein AAGD96_01350 [Chloroflexota bacterium]